MPHAPDGWHARLPSSGGERNSLTGGPNAEQPRIAQLPERMVKRPGSRLAGKHSDGFVEGVRIQRGASRDLTR